MLPRHRSRKFAVLLLLPGFLAGRAQTTAPAAGSASAPASGNATAPAPTPADLGNITVIGMLNEARSEIVSSLGATTYTVTKDQIETEPEGADAPFDQVLLRTPGMAEDWGGQVHLRGEHANLQYRINDVLLPEGIPGGFGQELDPRFVDSLQLITGSLPAQYGFRTAGIVDIQTKTGAFDQGGDVSFYGGSYDTVRPSFEYGGSEGKLNYYFEGSYDHNDLGLENPTPSATAIHDETDQFHAFSYVSYVLSDTSKVTGMVGASGGNFQIPDAPGQPAGTAPGGAPWPGAFDSSTLNETQDERNFYAIGAYQKSAGNLDMQVAVFGRYGSINFNPDSVGDLYLNGVASQVDRQLYSTGLQEDTSYQLNDNHTLRAGLMLQEEIAPTDTTTTVYELDGADNPVGAPFPIVDNHTLDAQFYGFYAQDEWKITPKLTLNYGFRADLYASADHESQLSPRLNAIYKLSNDTTLHAGYARYFTPPPLESVNPSSVTLFNGTSNESPVTQDDTIKAERADYFDAGVTHKLTPQWQVGLDGYYKVAKDQLDDGFFGQTLIPSAFNYQKGRIYGVEATTSYTNGGFATYANGAFSVAKGENINSAQFQIDPADLAYIQDHWIYMDHDQTLTGSTGASYTWKRTDGKTMVYTDVLFGSGLREDEVLANGSVIPNGSHVPSYYTLNIGAEYDIKAAAGPQWNIRLDLVNLLDRVYELRSGSGIGVNAAQFGERRGIFGSVGCSF